ncbi:MAG TPA: helix-hairpin-helix domain-containing protein [Tepidisphaeraceae bacterium]|nr:helix-hairpin-helix domain-containing protein [Tepidisphaeraceae bacterium]
MMQSRRTSRRARRGAIFVTALGIIVILSGLVLVFAQSMRTEAVASGNRLSYVQADAVEQGAEKWVLAQCETYPGDGVTITEVPAEALQIGSGYFWVLAPYQQDDQHYQFGITDEAGKLNINTASANQLIMLPGMDQQTADSIVTWRKKVGSNTGATSADGADTPDYNMLQEGYDAKHSTYETVEELMLVEGVTNGMLFGLDANRDGVVTDLERNNPDPTFTSSFNTVDGTNRGIFNDLTVYSIEPNTTISGGARINVNSTDTSKLLNYLTKTLSASRANQIVGRIRGLIRAARGRTVFSSIGSFYQLSGMTVQEFDLVADNLTASKAKSSTGLVNVNTAPLEVLMALPNVQESDAQAIVAQRSNIANSPSIGWVFQAVSPATAARMSQYITARSFQYSADIVAVSPDGRAFKRVRIVVDARQTPAKIVYRRDLTSLGWPLPDEVRTALKNGQPPPSLSGSTLGFGR